MNISKDLLLAILSLDSYNHGYNSGIVRGKNQIGAATAQDLLPDMIQVTGRALIFMQFRIL